MLRRMKTQRLIQIVVIAATVAMGTVQPAAAAVVPAGTQVVVQTTSTITSVDTRGTRVPALLARPLLSQGRVLVPAGAKVMGHVVTSRRIHQSQERLTVDITEIVVQGRAHPIRTTGATLVDNVNWKTKTGSTVTRGAYAVHAGRHLEFRLAQPLVL